MAPVPANTYKRTLKPLSAEDARRRIKLTQVSVQSAGAGSQHEGVKRVPSLLNKSDSSSTNNQNSNSISSSSSSTVTGPGGPGRSSTSGLISKSNLKRSSNSNAPVGARKSQVRIVDADINDTDDTNELMN